MNKKICIVTGTRAEFGLLRWLMESLNSHPSLSLQVIATGSHLSPEFGNTYKEIEDAGIKIDEKVEMLLSSDTSIGITKSMGIGIICFADALERLKPDLMVVLGDRFEAFVATSAAMIANIPIAHLHGGEITEGVVDEAIRHSITKMSHLHFVATDEYRKRVIQLGECPSRVFNVGGMGIDAIMRNKFLNRQQLENALGFKLGKQCLMVTFHPITLDDQISSIDQTRELLAALVKIKDTKFILTMPNADVGGREIGTLVQKFANENSNSCLVKSLGQNLYYSCLAHIDGVVGNSSSGILEAPAFRVGTVNIGNRQKGRICPESIVNCSPNRTEIFKSVEKILSKEFRKRIKTFENPYGEGGAVEKIIREINNINLRELKIKKFYDIEF